MSDIKTEQRQTALQSRPLRIEMPKGVEKVLSTLTSAGYEAYLVGGCVRDCLNGVMPHDYDITSSATPDQVMELFSKCIPTGIAHGTVTVIEDGELVEVTTMRKEGAYVDHRHPQSVEYTDDIREDLKRRDFTVNAMAWNPKSGLVDPFGGQEDLKNKIIRAVGDPAVRFEEDALRMFRAWRFAARLHARIDAETMKAIDEKSGLSSTLAAERVVPEMEEILAKGPHCLSHMVDLLAPWIPPLSDMARAEQNTPYHYASVIGHTMDALWYLPIKTPVTLWAALLHDCGKPAVRVTDENGRDHFKGHEKMSQKLSSDILAKLKLPTRVQSEIKMLICDHDTFFKPNLESLYELRVAKGYTDEQIQDLFALQQADILAHATLDRQILLDNFRAFYEQEKSRHPLSLKELKINGNDVAKRTSLQGKDRRIALQEVLHAVIVNPELDTREAQLACLDECAARIENTKKN